MQEVIVFAQPDGSTWSLVARTSPGQWCLLTGTPADGLNPSRLAGKDQVQNWLGEWWVYTLTFGIHTRAEGRRMNAFFNRLRGPATPFLFRDPSFQASLAGSAAVVGGATAALAEQVASSGWTAGTQIPAGTFFNIGTGASTRLHQIVEDVTASGTGTATLTIAPRLRDPIPAATPLIFAAPAVRLRLRDPVPSIIERAEIYTFSLSAEEAL